MNPFTVLGVTPGASEEEIKKAWRTLCRKWHPDRKGGDASKMAEVNVAYGILMDADQHAWWAEHGDERQPDPLDLKARTLVMSIFMAVIQQDFEKDPYRATHEVLLANIEKFRASASASKHKIKVLKAKRDKLKIKAGAGELFIGGVMDQMVAGHEQHIADCEQDEKTAQRARDLFDEWVEAVKKIGDKGHAERTLDPKMSFLKDFTDFGP